MDEGKKIRLTPHQAKTRIERFCAYRERSHKEVRDKLFSLGLYSEDVNRIMAHLIEQNFLNEERFAMAFVSGKFKMKGWGAKKIERELRMKGVGDYLVRKAMREIDKDEYEATLEKLALKKWNSLRDTNRLKKLNKVIRFLVTKGYGFEESRLQAERAAGTR